MKNLVKIHRIHEKSRECEENWKWNKAHVVTLPAIWAWICMLSLYVNEWLTPNTELLYQFLIAFFRICVGDYFYKWFSPFFFFIRFEIRKKKTTFIRSICKHLEHFSFKHDLFAFICIHWKYSASWIDGVDSGFPIQFAACLCQFCCYSTDLFSVYFCNVSIFRIIAIYFEFDSNAMWCCCLFFFSISALKLLVLLSMLWVNCLYSNTIFFMSILVNNKRSRFSFWMVSLKAFECF